ncbi:hypothetical protein A2U01_0064249, partial [Trifolium medium]|nr:hypothetical protein [Trifolium medium]
MQCATLGGPGQASSDNNAVFLGCFTVDLGIIIAFHAELIGV